MPIKESTKLHSKGFIRFIELIIFSFILFVLLVPNFFHYSNKNEWSEVNTLILCNDLLYSLERNKTFDDVLNPFVENSDFSGEHQKDLELLNNITEKVFPVAVDFEYEIKNVAPYKILIGCNCTEIQKKWLKEKILTPSYPFVDNSIDHISLSNLNDSKYDLFIIFGEVNLSKPAIKSNITAMLKRGKGLVLIRNFSSEPDDFTKKLFDIELSGSGLSTNNLNFNNLSNPKTARIAKRFVNNLIRINTSDGQGQINLKNMSFKINATRDNVSIENCTPSCIGEGMNCSISIANTNIILYQIDPLPMHWTTGDEEWIDIKISADGSNPRDYTFRDTFPANIGKNKSTILSDGSKAAANIKVLESYSNSYENEPRTFWIYDYNQTRDDLNLLLKTGIIWASGEHYFVFDKKIMNKRNYCQYFYSGVDGNNIPFLVKLYFFG